MIPELIAWSILVSAAFGFYRMFGAGVRSLRNGTLMPSALRRRTSRSSPATRAPAVTHAMKQAARSLQVALQQVRQAPDFRRPASYVAHAQNVPLWFRQRQYRRFRSLLVEHLAHLLGEGASVESIMPALTELVTGLGVAPFEADYIRTEAESRLSRQDNTPRADFGQQLRQTQAEYRGRVHTLEGMTDLDDETREQLLEQEQLRFQERMRQIATSGNNDRAAP